MNRNVMRRLAVAAGLALGLSGAAPLLLAAGDPVVVGADAPALPFWPFVVADVVNPATGRPCRPGERVRFQLDARTAFEGPVEDYLASLNDLEQKYTRLGQTLRQDGELRHTMAKDPALLNGQMLSDLRVSAVLLTDRVRSGVQRCETLRLAQLGVNPRTGAVFAADDRLEIEPGVGLSAAQFVARVNNIQSVLCTLGYDLLGELGGGDALARLGDAVRTLAAKRDELLDRLGLSRFDGKFDWQPIEDLRSYADIAAAAAKLAQAREAPSPEQLEVLRQKVNAQLPSDLQIPELPNIPAPTPVKRQDLAVKKRKDWTGLNEGDPSRFNAYATAYFEIRGSEKAEEADAEGKAGVFVLGNEINALYGFGQLYAGPDAVRGKLMLRAFGQDVFAPLEFSDSVSYKVSDRKHFHYGQEFAFHQQFFIGPIPVTVAAGASAEVFVGWELAVLTTELNAALTPGGDASAFVSGAVGIGGFLAAGAEGSVELIDLGPVLAGNAGLRFDPSGVPFLLLGLNADLALAALTGHVDLYAEYPVPRFGLPPWTTKRSTLELFSWPGLHENYKIFNWGMRVTPFGATMSGDLVDQTDRDETRHLQGLLDLDQRRLALAEVEVQVSRKEREVFAAIDADLGAPPNLGIPAEAEAVHRLQLAADNERNGYLDTLTQFASR